tara:strand:- start:329 stop:634 length:306 start_codon:yes stop_codon:yes gene_type:complete
MFERLSQEQFNYMIEAMCLYKTLNPNKEVTLSEKTGKEVMNFFNREGNRYIPMLNAMAESGMSMEELLQKSKEEMEKSKEESKVAEVSEEENLEEVDDDSN